MQSRIRKHDAAGRNLFDVEISIDGDEWFPIYTNLLNEVDAATLAGALVNR